MPNTVGILTAVVKASELGDNWSADHHVRVDGLRLWQHRRLQEIRRARAHHLACLNKLAEEEQALEVQRSCSEED